jgi:hypothetical protein
MADLRVFGKTPKGTAEITVRGGGLSLAQRRLLILVDGSRDVDQLSTMVTSDVEESLRVLQEGGYISLVGTGTRPAEATTVANPAPLVEAEMTSVAEAKVRAARALNDMLGPAADDLAIAIEKARNGEQLRPLIREAERLIGAAHGPAAAEAFIDAVRRR